MKEEALRNFLFQKEIQNHVLYGGQSLFSLSQLSLFHHLIKRLLSFQISRLLIIKHLVSLVMI